MGTQAFALAAVSLLLGVCGGWLIRKSFATRVPKPGQVVSAPPQNAARSQVLPQSFGSPAARPPAQELKEAADMQAAPLLEQLKCNPANAAHLAQLGNLYYDAKQCPTAIGYYERSLKSQPNNTSVRTDLGTAYWYNGDADTAVTQFNVVLSSEPNKPDTLVNLGVVNGRARRMRREPSPPGRNCWTQILAMRIRKTCCN
jgi:predicted Zn-dependent protease